MSGIVVSLEPIESLGLDSPHEQAKLENSMVGDGLEHCGIIADGRVFELPNRHDDPAHDFLLLGQDIEDVLEFWGLNEGDVTAIWHTHPGGNPYPSANDLNGHLPILENIRMVIVTEDSINVYLTSI